MNCPKCGKKISEGKCPSCGTIVIIGDEKCDHVENVPKNTEITPPATHFKINHISLILIIALSLIFFKSFLGDVLEADSIVSLILFLLMCVLIIMALLSSISVVYNITCPYCNRELEIPTDTNALDCPVCNERIIIENYTPKKK